MLLLVAEIHENYISSIQVSPEALANNSGALAQLVQSQISYDKFINAIARNSTHNQSLVSFICGKYLPVLRSVCESLFSVVDKVVLADAPLAE